MNLDAGDASHGGLHGLGVVDVGAGWGAKDVLDAEPVSEPDNGAEVAGVLHVVEGEAELLLGHLVDID